MNKFKNWLSFDSETLTGSSTFQNQRFRCTYNNHFKNVYMAAKQFLPQKTEHKLQDFENNDVENI
jgi:hypothetical protein